MKQTQESAIPEKSEKPVDWGEAVTRTFKFSFMPQRWLPLFVFDLAVISVALAVLFNVLTPAVMAGLATTDSVMQLVVMGTYILSLGIVWFFVNLWVTGAIAHQCWKPAEFRQSWKASWKRYPSILAVSLIAGAANFLAAMIPFAGPVISIVIGMMFMFVIPFIFVSGANFADSLSGSVKMFRYSFLKVFITWLLNVVLTLLIALIFALPLLVYFLYYFSQYGFTEAIAYMILYNDRTLLYGTCAILLAGFSIIRVFGLKLLTEVYMQMTRKSLLEFLKKGEEG